MLPLGSMPYDEDRLMWLAAFAHVEPDYLLTPPLRGRLARWRWRRMRRRLEYRLFRMGGIFGSVEWQRVKEENNVLGVW